MTQNFDDNSRRHPYTDWEKTPLWDAIDRALAELEENRDVRLSTPRAYVIGFICRQIEKDLEPPGFERKK